jgi:hypothetical protein
MTASYPTSLKSFTTQVDNVDDANAAWANAAQDEILAIETELGTDVAGSATDLKTRLAVALSAAGLLNFAASTLLTISSGSITATQNWHRVDTESSAASDDLDTITAGTDGQVLFLRSVADARNVVIKNGTGNILTTGGKDITLDLYADLAIGVYDDVVDKWIFTGVTGAGLLNTANTWTGVNVFSAAMSTKYSAVNANTTLGATYQTVAVDATSGNITITLPAASTCTGRRYDIKKIDGSANTVTIDGNSAETIDGAATKVISTQYSTYTIISNGSGWYVL